MTGEDLKSELVAIINKFQNEMLVMVTSITIESVIHRSEHISDGEHPCADYVLITHVGMKMKSL